MNRPNIFNKGLSHFFVDHMSPHFGIVFLETLALNGENRNDFFRFEFCSSFFFLFFSS